MFVHYKLIRIKIWAGFRGYAQFDCCYITITTDACKVLTPVQEKMLFCANKENGTQFSLLLDIDWFDCLPAPGWHWRQGCFATRTKRPFFRWNVNGTEYDRSASTESTVGRQLMTPV